MSTSALPWRARLRFARLHRRALRRGPFLDQGGLSALVTQLMQAYALPEALRALLTDLIAVSPCATSLTQVFHLGEVAGAERAAIEQERHATRNRTTRPDPTGGSGLATPLPTFLRTGQFDRTVHKYYQAGRGSTTLPRAIEQAVTELTSQERAVSAAPSPVVATNGNRHRAMASRPYPPTGQQPSPLFLRRAPGTQHASRHGQVSRIPTEPLPLPPPSCVAHPQLAHGLDHRLPPQGDVREVSGAGETVAGEGEAAGAAQERPGEEDVAPTERNPALARLLHSATTEPEAVSSPRRGGDEFLR